MMQTHRCWQHTLMAVAFLSCFCAIFYVYHRPTLNWFQCPKVRVSKPSDCADACINALMNNSCAVNLTSVKNPTQANPTPPETLLLIWTWPFGFKFPLDSCRSHFNIEGCRLTDDRNLYDEAHGVLFHHGDIPQDLSDMPTAPRPRFQKWVWMNMESPSNSVPKPRLNDLFNLTATYRRDSDISVPYGRIVEKSDGSYATPPKEKFVCWIVSNWNPSYERSKFYEILKRHVAVETYGAYFDKRVRDEDFPGLVSTCKFYLSFENSVHEDYITEKLYTPMSLGTVPVVLGPSRANYEALVPAEAFIHVDDFANAKELATHLKLLDQNADMYRKYFSWREHYSATESLFGMEHACRSCDHIRRNPNYRTVKDLNTWFWGS